MLKILLTSHGKMCEGLKDTVSLFSVEKTIDAIPFYSEGHDGEKELDQYLSELSAEDKLIIVSDILWGSVNQLLMRKIRERKNIYIITGMNLPLLLQLVCMNESDVDHDALAKVASNAKESIVFMADYSPEFEDGDE